MRNRIQVAIPFNQQHFFFMQLKNIKVEHKNKQNLLYFFKSDCKH